MTINETRLSTYNKYRRMVRITTVEDNVFVLYQDYIRPNKLFVSEFNHYSKSIDVVDYQNQDTVCMVGIFSTLDELQDLLSLYSEWVNDKKWTNPYFKDIDELISWSENKFKELISCK